MTHDLTTIAGIGARYDALGYTDLALWLAWFVLACEAV